MAILTSIIPSSQYRTAEPYTLVTAKSVNVKTLACFPENGIAHYFRDPEIVGNKLIVYPFIAVVDGIVILFGDKDNPDTPVAEIEIDPSKEYHLGAYFKLDKTKSQQEPAKLFLSDDLNDFETDKRYTCRVCSVIQDTENGGVKIDPDSIMSYYKKIKYGITSTSDTTDDTSASSIDFSTLIEKPTITYPSNGGSLDAGKYITSSPFTATSDQFVLYHNASDWEVATDSEFQNIVFSSYNDRVHKTEIIFPFNPATEYYVRVRYISNIGLKSDWSDPVQFTTPSNYEAPTEIMTPELRVYGFEADNVRTLTPIIIGSPFTVLNGDDVHVSTDWIVYDQSNAVKWQSLNDTVNKTSINLKQANLENKQNYLVTAKYNGQNASSPTGYLNIYINAPVFNETFNVFASTDNYSSITAVGDYIFDFYESDSIKVYKLTESGLIELLDLKDYGRFVGTQGYNFSFIDGGIDNNGTPYFVGYSNTGKNNRLYKYDESLNSLVIIKDIYVTNYGGNYTSYFSSVMNKRQFGEDTLLCTSLNNFYFNISANKFNINGPTYIAKPNTNTTLKPIFMTHNYCVDFKADSTKVLFKSLDDLTTIVHEITISGHPYESYLSNMTYGAYGTPIWRMRQIETFFAYKTSNGYITIFDTSDVNDPLKLVSATYCNTNVYGISTTDEYLILGYLNTSSSVWIYTITLYDKYTYQTIKSYTFDVKEMMAKYYPTITLSNANYFGTLDYSAAFDKVVVTMTLNDNKTHVVYTVPLQDILNS